MPTDALGISTNDINVVGGGFRFANTLVMTFQTTSASTPRAYAGFIIQNVNAQYRQPVTRLRGMNTKFVYFVAAPPEGNMTLGTIIGHPEGTEEFVQAMADPCKVAENIVSFSGPYGCTDNYYGNENDATMNMRTLTVNPGSNRKLTALRQQLHAVGCLIESIDFSMELQNLMLNMNTTLQFVNLVLDSN